MKAFNLPMQNSFARYALKHVSPETLKCYLSHLKSLNNQYFEIVKGNSVSPFHLCTFEAVKIYGYVVVNMLNDWEQSFNEEIKKPKILKNKSQNTLQNWQSAFAMYKKFIYLLVKVVKAQEL